MEMDRANTGKKFILLLVAMIMAISLSGYIAEATMFGNRSLPDTTSEDDLTSTQRNSINMLNYMTVLTQKINQSSKNQAFLESAYSALANDLYPNAVDGATQAQSLSLLDTINNYRMISVKWDRIRYIYEQNRAQAFRRAIPNPMGLLSTVQSQNMLQTAASVLYMAIDAKNSYDSAVSQADLQFLKDGWELEDAESAELHNSIKASLNYMYSMVRTYDLPGDYALNRESVENFVNWISNPNLVRKIAWLEENHKTYREFGPYWLELAKFYYDSGDYRKCLDAIHRYEGISARIFRKDLDYANALPMAIAAAKEVMDKNEYTKLADKYCSSILANTKDADWSVRYFAAQTYLDLYAQTRDSSYMEAAYRIVLNNVNILVSEQRKLNAAYLADIEEVKPKDGATKREKKELEEYNKLLKEERKVALPPVNEALYLNCSLLSALADELNIPNKEQRRIESIIHENGAPIFLCETLDRRFWFGKKDTTALATDNIAIEFDGKKLVIPATCTSDRSVISVTVTNSSGKETVINDWIVKEVERPAESSSWDWVPFVSGATSSNISDFKATFTSNTAEDYEYQAGDTVVITVMPASDVLEDAVTFTYKIVTDKRLNFFGLRDKVTLLDEVPLLDGISFERI